jgi:endonuclease-3
MSVKKAERKPKPQAPKASGKKPKAGRSRSAKERREPTAERRERARKVLAELKKLYPEAHCALIHRSALELLVATILSAQSTDATVNKVTPLLFGRYPDARALAGAESAELERLIHSTGFFRQKTKSIQGACRRLVEAYGGEVPGAMEDLLTLPGVARKTANVILGTWFSKNEGIVVDTHVGRLTHRLGLTWSSRDEKDAVAIEKDLMQLLPREEWTFFGHAMIWHGRQVCTARRPNWESCSMASFCPSAFRQRLPV